MKSFLNPLEILRQLKLRNDIIAIDFGCGSGGWVIPLAKTLEQGIVYALDVLEEPLSVLRSTMAFEKIKNIRIIRSNIENKSGSTLSDASVDLVLMTNLLFQIDNKKEVFLEAKRILKNKGKILVIDWKEDFSQGPEKNKVSEKEIKKIANDLDFNLEKEFVAGIYHYGLIFEKS